MSKFCLTTDGEGTRIRDRNKYNYFIVKRNRILINRHCVKQSDQHLFSDALVTGRLHKWNSGRNQEPSLFPPSPIRKVMRSIENVFFLILKILL